MCIIFFFNVSHFLYIKIRCIRDDSSLRNRYKRVLYEMRLHTKGQQMNSNAGEPMLPKPKEVKIEPTGSILQVFHRFGHLLMPNAIRHVDSDGPLFLNNAIANSTVAEQDIVENDSIDSVDDDLHSTSNTSTAIATITSGAYVALMQNLTAENEFVPETVASNAAELISQFESSPPPIVTEAVPASNVAEIHSQFESSPPPIVTGAMFASNETDDQRERPSSNNHSRIQSMESQFWKKRCEYMELKKQQANELHAMRRSIYQRQLAFWDAAVANRYAASAASSVGNVITTTNTDAFLTTSNTDVFLTTTAPSVAIAERNITTNTEAIVDTSGPPTAVIGPFTWNVHPTPPRIEEDPDMGDFLEEYLTDIEEPLDSPGGLSDDPYDEDYVP